MFKYYRVIFNTVNEHGVNEVGYFYYYRSDKELDKKDFEKILNDQFIKNEYKTRVSDIYEVEKVSEEDFNSFILPGFYKL